jgi:S-layer protein (TIGR01564 family)
MQRLKQAIRRVAALGVGVAMLGATVTGAVAQAASLDLANLPEPFVSKEGVFDQDTALVVGSKADVSDVLGLGDVTAKLQFLTVNV